MLIFLSWQALIDGDFVRPPGLWRGCSTRTHAAIFPRRTFEKRCSGEEEASVEVGLLGV